MIHPNLIKTLKQELEKLKDSKMNNEIKPVRTIQEFTVGAISQLILKSLGIEGSVEFEVSENRDYLDNSIGYRLTKVKVIQNNEQLEL